MPHPDTSRVDDPEGFVIDVVGFEKYSCPDCGAKLMKSQELIGHRKTAHKYKAPEAEQVLDGNRCPKCNMPFSNKASAMRHIRSNEAREVCDSTGGPSTRRSLLEDVPEDAGRGRGRRKGRREGEGQEEKGRGRRVGRR